MIFQFTFLRKIVSSYSKSAVDIFLFSIVKSSRGKLRWNFETIKTESDFINNRKQTNTNRQLWTKLLKILGQKKKKGKT